MTLEESIAKLNLGELSLSQFPNIASVAIEKGIDSESLLILAGMDDTDNAFEIRQYLDRVIEELNIKSHQSLDAAFVLANAYVNSFKSGNIDVIECIHKIKNDCWSNCEEEIGSQKYVYDGVQFEKIIGPWYEYVEIDEFTDWVRESDKSLAEIKKEIENDLEKMVIKWQAEFLSKKLVS